MNYQQLKDYVEGTLSENDFFTLISLEVHEYRISINSGKSSIPISVNNQVDEELFVTHLFIQKLRGLEQFKIYFVSYICDALMMLENIKFEKEETKEKCENLIIDEPINYKELERASFEKYKNNLNIGNDDLIISKASSSSGYFRVDRLFMLFAFYTNELPTPDQVIEEFLKEYSIKRKDKDNSGGYVYILPAEDF